MARQLGHALSVWRRLAHRPLAPERRRQVFAGLIVAAVFVLSWFVGQAWTVARQALPAAGIDPAMNPGRTQQVNAATATMSLAADTVFQQDEITISGSGFSPLETVIVRVADQGQEARELLRAAADWHGSFAGQSVSLPEWLVSGAHSLQASGDRSGTRGDSTLYVRAKERWINLSSFGVKQADKLGFVAGGFDPGDKINVYLAEGQDRQPADDASPILQLDADKAGNTSWLELSVPIVKPGTYSFIVRSSAGGPAISRNIVVSALVPNVELSPWSGPPGSRIEMNASGFVPNEEVAVFLGDAEQPATTVPVDQYGNFWAAGPIELPYDARGQFRVTLIGSTSHALVTRTFGVVAPKPWVELSTYSGFAGTTVYFSGGGFSARERITIHVERAEGPTIGVGEANEQGYYRFIGPVNVPPAATDDVTFVLVGDQSHTSGTATFKVLTPWFNQPPPDRQ